MPLTNLTNGNLLEKMKMLNNCRHSHSGSLEKIISSFIYCSGNPYFRAILSNFDALSIYALNVLEPDVGSGYAEHGDGIVQDLVTLVSYRKLENAK